MKILVTGGTGVVGVATINALREMGHDVRLLSRRAHEAIEQWTDGVEAFVGDVSQAESIRGAGRGCQAVLHLAGLVKDEGARTLDQVNVQGTRNVLGEAQRSGIQRLVYISSLGADTGASDYHRSKRAAEHHVSEFAGSYTIVRLANVYGPGDPAISALLKMVRTLPAVPVIDSGDQPFQPVWHLDAGQALAQLVTAAAAPSGVVALAGRESTSTNQLLDHFERITGRTPTRIPLPSFLASWGAQAAELLGHPLPVSDAALTMLNEEHSIQPGQVNLLDQFGIQGTALADGLSLLADAQPETTPGDGVGALTHRRVWVDIKHASLSAEALFERFRANFNDFVPIEAAAEPGSPTAISEGTTLTLKLALRGNVQVRAEKAEDNEITLATLEGHPLAGFVHFAFRQDDSRIHFEVDAYDRPANLLDRIGMLIGGNIAQRETWRATAERVIEVSGGIAPDGVQHKSETLPDAKAERIERFAADIIQRRKRRQENKV